MPAPQQSWHAPARRTRGAVLCFLLHEPNMTVVPRDLSCAALPEPWRHALLQHHEKPRSGQGGSGRFETKWTADEDACILHHGYGPTIVSWPNANRPMPSRTADANRRRNQRLKTEGVLNACGEWPSAAASAAADTGTPATSLPGELLTLAAASAPNGARKSSRASTPNDTVAAYGSWPATVSNAACYTCWPTAHRCMLWFHCRHCAAVRAG